MICIENTKQIVFAKKFYGFKNYLKNLCLKTLKQNVCNEKVNGLVLLLNSTLTNE